MRPVLNLPVAVYERGRVGEHLQPLGPRPPVQPVRHELHAAGPRRHPRRAAAARISRPTAIAHRPRAPDRLPGAAGQDGAAPRLPSDRNQVLHGRPPRLSQGGRARRRRPGQAAVPPAVARRQGQASASKRPTWCSIAPAPTASTAGWATAAFPAVGEVAAGAATSPTAWKTSSASAAITYAGKTIVVVGCGLLGGRRRFATWPPWPSKHLETWVDLAGARRRARSRSRASPTTRCASATGWRCGPTRWRRAPTATSSSIRRASVETMESAGPDKGFRVTARSAGKAVTWDVDRVDSQRRLFAGPELYRELQVPESCAICAVVRPARAARSRTSSSSAPRVTAATRISS